MHTLKGLGEALGQKEFTHNIHLLEGTLQEIQLEGISTLKSYIEQWERPLQIIRKIGRDLYLNSSLFKPIKVTEESLFNLVNDFYEMVSDWMHSGFEKDKKFLKKLETLNANSMSFNLYSVPINIRSLYEFFSNPDLKNKSQGDELLRNIWKILRLFLQLDLEKSIFAPVRDNIISHLRKFRAGDEWEALLKEIYRISEIDREPFFIKFFKKFMRVEGNDYKRFINVLNYLEEKEEKSLEEFIPQTDCIDYLSELFSCLKEDFSLESLNQVGFSENKVSESIKSLEVIIRKIDKSPSSYIESIDLMSLIASYIDLESDIEKQMKPDVIEVLHDNFVGFKKSIQGMVGKEVRLPWEKTEKLIDSLTFQPIKYSLRNLKTMAEDISKGVGKKIKFTIKGEQGSLEKEKLVLLKDAAVHLIRNSIDHGIELPKIRVENGKSEFGLIDIFCSYDPDGAFVIEIKDDGGGIDPEKIYQKAIEKGIVAESTSQKMKPEDKLNLIFMPNFSTKQSVTELSGRGVGMDVVKSNLEKIGAKLSLDSVYGKGTHFKISFPKNEIRVLP